MASLLHPHVLPASEHPSLNLDLSLGSLFSEHHASSETMATAQSGVTECKIAATPTSRRRSAADSSSPALYANEPVHLPSPKALQAQRWHAARKRRKSIIEEKLHRRFNGDNFSLGEGALTQSRLADCTMQGFEWDVYEGRAHEQKSLALGHATPSSVKLGELHDLGHSMLSGAVYDVSCNHKHGSDGDVSSPVQLRTPRGHGKLRLCIPTGESDAPEDQCTHFFNGSCVDSPKDQRVPCGNSPSTLSLYSQSAQHSAASIPRSASSSSICTGLMFEKRRRLDATYGEGVDDHDNKQKSCNSSSSGLENEYSQSIMPNESSEAQSSRCNSKDGLAGVVYSSVSTPSSSMAYPYTTRPVVRPSYPYGFPLHWGSSLPWFMHYLPHMAVGAMSSMSPSPFSEKAYEVTSLPQAPSVPFHDPHSAHEKLASPAHQCIPAAGTANISPTACGQEKMKNDTTADLSSVHADVDGKDPTFLQVQEDNATSDGHLENVGGARDDNKESPQKTAHFNLKADKAKKRKQQQKHVTSQAATTLDSPGISSAPSELSKRPEALSKDCGPGEIRHHSLPDSCGRVSKKAKFVRFNSLDNKVIQLEQEQQSHSHHSLTGELLENDASTCSTNHDRLESLHAHSKTRTTLPLQGTCGEYRKTADRINRNLDDTNMCRQVDEPIDVPNNQNDEEMGCGYADDKKDGYSQSRTSVSEDEEEEPFASMPRVTTRGSGPFGRIIHGAMYITKGKQARLICSCHGKHMSPVEFVQHSGSNDLSHPERSIVLRPLPHVASGLSSS